jgi:hypothetical protein
MFTKALWSMALAAFLLLPLSARAAEIGNGNWDDDWDYVQSDEAFAYPEPAPAPAKNTACLNGVNHFGSPCNCPPIVPEDPIPGDEPMVCENPFGDDEAFLDDFKNAHKEKPDFSDDLPVTRDGSGHTKCNCDGTFSSPLKKWRPAQG